MKTTEKILMGLLVAGGILSVIVLAKQQGSPFHKQSTGENTTLDGEQNNDNGPASLSNSITQEAIPVRHGNGIQYLLAPSIIYPFLTENTFLESRIKNFPRLMPTYQFTISDTTISLYDSQPNLVLLHSKALGERGYTCINIYQTFIELLPFDSVATEKESDGSSNVGENQNTAEEETKKGSTILIQHSNLEEVIPSFAHTSAEKGVVVRYGDGTEYVLELATMRNFLSSHELKLNSDITLPRLMPSYQFVLSEDTISLYSSKPNLIVYQSEEWGERAYQSDDIYAHFVSFLKSEGEQS